MSACSSRYELDGIHIHVPHSICDFKEIVQNTACDLTFADTINNLKPWRKGPFYFHFVDELFIIDSEWNSFIKLNKLVEIFRSLDIILDGKKLLDVGCNNGFYMLALACMYDINICGLDPVPLYESQFHFVNSFMKCHVEFVRTGIHDYKVQLFDIVLCLGVLYHRPDPLLTLKKLKKCMGPRSYLILETLIILTEDDICLVPDKYARMKNVYFVFSPSALANLAKKAGFNSCIIISHSFTDDSEQRSTVYASSLGDYLHENNGHYRPCRGFFYLI